MGVLGLAVGWGSATSAAGDTLSVDLNNGTAPLGDDCPDTVNAYWHFVVAPNDDSFSFVSIHLNIDGVGVTTFTGADIVPNGSQTDNVFVRVPDGSELDDLVESGSFAEISPADGDPRFVFSHRCDPQATAPTTTVPATTTTVVESTTTTLFGQGGPTTTTTVPDITLPETGPRSTGGAASVGMLFVALGVGLVVASRRPDRHPA